MTPSIRHPLQANECLFFLHIPKTAGTSFTAVLQNRFSAEETSPLARWADALKTPTADFQKYRLITAHITYGLHQIVPHPLVYVTMLRDPVERVISQYEDILRVGPHYPFKRLFTQNMSLYEYVTDPEYRIASSNTQVVMLGENYSLPLIQELYANHAYDDVFVPNPAGLPDNEYLRRAKQRLESFAFFGLMERFSDSINILTYTFGWPPVVAIQKLNTPSRRLKREDLPQSTLDAIIEHNQLDIALYNFARDLFEQRYAQMLGELLEQDYQTQSAATAVPTDTLKLDLSRPFNGTGWHPPDAKDPHMRWTGPGTISTIDLLLAHNKPLVLTFRVVNVLAQDILDNFRLEVNYQLVELVADDSGGLHGIKLRAILRPEVLRESHLTHFNFMVNRTVRPRDFLPDNQDDRLLGIAITDLQIAPYPRRLTRLANRLMPS